MDRRGHSDPEPDDVGEVAWVETEAPDRWQPPVGERVRAAGILLGVLGVFLVLAVVVAVAPGGAGDDDADLAAGEGSATTENVEVTAPTSLPTTTLPPDPASIAGEPPPERCARDNRGSRDLRPPAQIEVQVLNATPRAGHASDVTAAIDGLGYRTVTPGNAGREPVTVIRFAGGWCAEADRLAEQLQLPQAKVELVPRGEEREIGSTDLLVVLGADSL